MQYFILLTLTVSFLTYFFLKHSNFFPPFQCGFHFSVCCFQLPCPRGREREKEGWLVSNSFFLNGNRGGSHP